MVHFRKCLWALTALALLFCLALPASAAEDSPEPYIQRLLQYYRYYQEDAQEDIDVLLSYIAYLDPDQGARWQVIMEGWSRSNQLDVCLNGLPEDLPQDDSLCIVVLGYGLKSNGGMRSELVSRLNVALTAARAYPNAYIALTGGPTASKSDATEAGQMAAWLTARGIDPARLVVEDQSLSTTENAVNTYHILENRYPSVTSIALISSDYHVHWGCALFQAASDCSAFRGGRAIPVIACGANPTDTTWNTLEAQAKGIAGIPYDEGNAPPPPVT